jgi:hypothetical protein
MSVLPLGHCVIYALVDPKSGLVRYVGSTTAPMTRMQGHMRMGPRDTSIKNAWIKTLVDCGLAPVFVFLESVTEEDTPAAESRWIDHFSKISPLLNQRKIYLKSNCKMK